jgi:putative flippase GtrA
MVDNTMQDSKSVETKTNKKSRGVCLAVIHWIQAQRLPKCLRKEGGDKDGVPIITGIDRVLFGTQPAAEVVEVLGVHPPRYLCYMLSGSGCDILQFFFDVMLHVVFHFEDASLCWALGFGLSVVFRHTTHRYLVFGDYVGGYWASLGRMYAGYSIIIVLSTIFNVIMTRYAKFPHYVAWIITMLWTGIVNYFILKKLWSFGGKPAKREGSKSDGEEAVDQEMAGLMRTDIHR